MAFVVGEQTSGIPSRNFWAETWNLEIQDGEDVDVLRRPGDLYHENGGTRFKVAISNKSVL